MTKRKSNRGAGARMNMPQREADVDVFSAATSENPGARKGKGKRRAETRVPQSEAHAGLPVASIHGTGGEGANYCVPQLEARVGVPLADRISALVAHGRKRAARIKMISQQERMLDSWLVMEILDMPQNLKKGEQEPWFKRAAALRESLVKQMIKNRARFHANKSTEPLTLPDTDDGRLVAGIAGAFEMMHSVAATVVLLRQQREKYESAMEEIAPTLPAYSLVKTINGFGDRGFGVIIGRTGDLSDYANKGKLRKRLGLAPYRGRAPSIWRRRGGLSKEEWKDELKYRPRFLADVFAFIYDSMFKHQWRGDKDEDGNDPKKSKKPVAVPAHAIGAYGEVYGRKRSEYLPRVAATMHLDPKHPDKWTLKRVDMAARRYMAQRVMEDVRKQWGREAGNPVAEGPAIRVPPSAIADAAD